MRVKTRAPRTSRTPGAPVRSPASDSARVTPAIARVAERTIALAAQFASLFIPHGAAAPQLALAKAAGRKQMHGGPHPKNNCDGRKGNTNIEQHGRHVLNTVISQKRRYRISRWREKQAPDRLTSDSAAGGV